MRMAIFLSGRRLFSPQTRCALPLLLAALSVFAQAPQPAPALSPQVPPVQESAPAAEQAQRPLPQGLRVLELKGLITQKFVPRFRAALEGTDPNRFPAGAIILIDSPGGDGLAAIEIGRMVREAKAHVFVRGKCASGCVYVLAGGVVRGVGSDKAIGIHRARLTTFVKGIGVVDVNAASNPKAAAALEIGNRRSREYFSDMGLPDAFYAAMAATPAEGMRYLDLAELPAFGLVGFDAEYLAARAPGAAKIYQVSEQEYVRRTLAMPAKCLADPVATPHEVVRCYRRVLRTGE